MALILDESSSCEQQCSSWPFWFTWLAEWRVILGPVVSRDNAVNGTSCCNTEISFLQASISLTSRSSHINCVNKTGLDLLPSCCTRHDALATCIAAQFGHSSFVVDLNSIVLDIITCVYNNNTHDYFTRPAGDITDAKERAVTVPSHNWSVWFSFWFIF